MSAPDVEHLLAHPNCDELFRKIEARFQTSNIPSDQWYLAALSSLTTTSEPQLAEQLYLYLIKQPTYSTPEAHQVLTRRMREALIKGIPLIGLPKTAEALLAISKVQTDDDLDSSFSREGWMCNGSNHTRGMNWLQRIYAQNVTSLFEMFKNHRDFWFYITEICYGLHLSDRQILDDLETEMVVLPAVMGQNLPRETFWHMRGMRRLGVSKEDVEMVCDCVKDIARFCGRELDRIYPVESVEGQL